MMIESFCFTATTHLGMFIPLSENFQYWISVGFVENSIFFHSHKANLPIIKDPYLYCFPGKSFFNQLGCFQYTMKIKLLHVINVLYLSIINL